MTILLSYVRRAYKALGLVLDQTAFAKDLAVSVQSVSTCP